MNKQQLEGKTVKELIEMAKELQITGRHKMKKPELVEAIIANQPTEEVQEVETQEVSLTNNEKSILNAMRTNEYNDAFDAPTYVFTAIDNSIVSGKAAAGVISSLVKKDLVVVIEDIEENLIYFTEKGKELFNGKETLELDLNPTEKVMHSEKMQEISAEANAIVEHYLEKGKKGGSKSVQILDKETGEEVISFDKTYEASRWLAEKFEVKYSTVDRYLVNTLKGKEMKLPKQLVGTEFENYEFRR